MKKFYISLFIAALGNQVSYAYNNNLKETTSFFCPSQISLYNTFYQNGDRNVWGDFVNYENIFTNKSLQALPKFSGSLFKFKGVDAPYHTPGFPICQYQLDTDPTFTLSFFRKEANYEAVPSKNWAINEYGASCIATNPTQCPLTNGSSIAIHDIDINQAVFSINGKVITVVYASNEWAYILYDDALKACAGSGTSCIVDIIINDFKVGSIDVNMENGMKIESIHTMLKQYSIKQIEDPSFAKSNSIEISNATDQQAQGH